MAEPTDDLTSLEGANHAAKPHAASAAGLRSDLPIVVVGGGIAGLAAAWHANQLGIPTVVLERRGTLGGRTSSFSERHTRELVDTGQHVILGSCRAFLQMIADLGLDSLIHLQPRMRVTFRDGTRVGRLRSSWYAPGTLHALPSLLAFPHLTFREKRALLRGLLLIKRVEPFDPDALVDAEIADALDETEATSTSEQRRISNRQRAVATRLTQRLKRDPGLRLLGEQLRYDDMPFGQWLREVARQPARVIERFWDVLSVATCNAGADDVSAFVARFVFRTAFFGGRHAAKIGYARVPLGVLCERIGDALIARGVQVFRRATAIDLSPADPSLGPAVHYRQAGEEHRLVGRGIVLATPLRETARLLASAELPTSRGGSQAWDCEDAFFAGHAPAAIARERAPHGRFNLDACLRHESAIVGVNLWYDRPVMTEPFAALLGATAQWVFDRNAIHDPALLRNSDTARNALAETSTSNSHDRFGVVVSISAADNLVRQPRDRLIATVAAEIAEAYPAARHAKLLAASVVPWMGATVIPGPGQARLRPHVDSLPPELGFTLAGGDCASTDEPWPPTIENAVRTGIEAVRAIEQPYAAPSRPKTVVQKQPSPNDKRGESEKLS